jgi:hypothetical protein
LPVRWQFFGFEGIVDPQAERTRARLSPLEQEAHAPHVISKLAALYLVFSGLLNATIFFVDRALGAIAFAGASDAGSFRAGVVAAP